MDSLCSMTTNRLFKWISRKVSINLDWHPVCTRENMCTSEHLYIQIVLRFMLFLFKIWTDTTVWSWCEDTCTSYELFFAQSIATPSCHFLSFVSCIIFYRRFVVRQMMIANTLFRTVCYHPEEFQIITSGTDRKVCFGIKNLFFSCC